MALRRVVVWWRRWLSAGAPAAAPRAAAPGRVSAAYREARGWLRRHAILLDVALAVAAAAGTVPQLGHYVRAADPRFPVYLLFTVLLVVPLTCRRRWPLATFAFVAVVALAHSIVGVELSADVVLLIFLYTVASRYPLRVAVLAAGVVEVGTLMAALRWPLTDTWADTFVLMSGLAVASLLLGVNVRQQRNVVNALSQRAQQLQRERDQQAIIAAADERTRIAREMHDVVAHSLSAMVTLSDGAALKQATEPERAHVAMRQVSTTGRQALDEMRRLLGVLRAVDVSGGRQPQPGFAQLDGLFDQVRATGLAAALTVSGPPAAVSPGLELTVYRVVQEALTNTLKHAERPTQVSVDVIHRVDSVTVEVHDNGTGRPSGRPAGHGLVGMRERVAVYDGTVRAGPHPTGGWQVRVHLPLPPATGMAGRNGCAR